MYNKGPDGIVRMRSMIRISTYNPRHLLAYHDSTGLTTALFVCCCFVSFEKTADNVLQTYSSAA